MSIPLPLRLILVSVVFVLSASFNASLPSLTIRLSDFTQNKKLISCVFGTGTIHFCLHSRLRLVSDEFVFKASQSFTMSSSPIRFAVEEALN